VGCRGFAVTNPTKLMEKDNGHHPDVAKYREGFIKPESDYPSHSWERTFMVGPELIDIPHALVENPRERRDHWEKTLEGENPQTDPKERAAARLARAIIQSGLTEKEYLLACPGLFRYAYDKNRELDPAAIGRIFREFAGTASKMGYWPDEVLSGKLNKEERIALFGQVYGQVKGHQHIMNDRDPQLTDRREQMNRWGRESSLLKPDGFPDHAPSAAEGPKAHAAKGWRRFFPGKGKD
jgi:hypothetical protein